MESTRSTFTRNAALVVPVLLVNAVAVWGQSGWAYDNIVPERNLAGLAIAIGFAAAIESIGIFLASEAHIALLAGDSALKLRLGSYAIGALAGVLNFVHFAGPDGSATPAAVAFAAMSALSPWLWAIRSRSLHRDQLRARGLIESRAVRLSSSRWFWYPFRSLRVTRAAVWAGETDPTRAVALVDFSTDHRAGRRESGRSGRKGIFGRSSQVTDGRLSGQNGSRASETAGKGSDGSTASTERGNAGAGATSQDTTNDVAPAGTNPVGTRSSAGTNPGATRSPAGRNPGGNRAGTRSPAGTNPGTATGSKSALARAALIDCNGNAPAALARLQSQGHDVSQRTVYNQRSALLAAGLIAENAPADTATESATAADETPATDAPADTPRLAVVTS